jgi:hypothetical protein
VINCEESDFCCSGSPMGLKYRARGKATNHWAEPGAIENFKSLSLPWNRRRLDKNYYICIYSTVHTTQDVTHMVYSILIYKKMILPESKCSQFGAIFQAGLGSVSEELVKCYNKIKTGNQLTNSFIHVPLTKTEHCMKIRMHFSLPMYINAGSPVVSTDVSYNSHKTEQKGQVVAWGGGSLCPCVSPGDLGRVLLLLV